MASNNDSKKKYNWYKHHAWAALALLSIFITLSRYIGNVPSNISFPMVILLSIYALVAIFFTYRHNKENIENKPVIITRPIEDINGAKLEKDKLKIEKKRLKAEAKVAKKRDD